MNFSQVIIISNIFLSRLCLCMTVMGIIDYYTTKNDWFAITEFCYTIPPDKEGQILSEVSVVSSGHKLIVLKDDDQSKIMNDKRLAAWRPKRSVDNLYSLNRFLSESFSNATGIGIPKLENLDTKTASETLITKNEKLNTLSENNKNQTVNAVSISRRDSDLLKPNQYNHGSRDVEVVNYPPEETKFATTYCEGIVEKARVRENLTPRQMYKNEKISDTSFGGQKLKIRVQPHVSMHKVHVMITRCGGPLDAEYRLELINPGGMFKKHFSCQEQGILELFLILSIICFVLFTFFYKINNSLPLVNREHPVTAVITLAVVGFFVFIVFQTLHLLVYSKDGIGLGLLSFLGSLGYLVYTLSIYFIISHFCLNSFRSENEITKITFTSIQIDIMSAEVHLLTNSFIAIIFTIVSNLQMPKPSEPLIPVAKLYEWWALGGWITFPISFLYCFSRIIFSIIVFRHSIQKTNSTSERIAIVWLCIPSFLTLFRSTLKKLSNHSPLMILMGFNIYILFVIVSQLKKANFGTNEAQNQAENQRLVVGKTGHYWKETFKTPAWDHDDDEEPQLLDFSEKPIQFKLAKSSNENVDTEN